MKTNIILLDVKQALRDHRFRGSLPEGFKPLVDKYLQNPSCGCNIPLYKKLFKECKKQLEDFYPDKIVENVEQEIEKLDENYWTVINCHVNELEDELKKLPAGRKQLAITRFEDQITVVVNELDVL